MVFDTYNASIIEDYIKLPYSFSFDGTVYTAYCMYKIIESDAGTLLSFDDYFKDNWDAVVPYFYAHGMKATWFCAGDVSRSGLLDFAKQAQFYGQEIGYHTKLHKRLDAMTLEQIADTAITPLADFENEGIVMKSMSLPGGIMPSDEGMEQLKSAYSVVRTSGDGGKFHIYTAEEIKAGFIYGQSIDWLFFKSDEVFKKKVQNWLIITKLTNTVWSAFSHYFLETEDSHYYSGGEIYDNYTIKYSNLLYLFDVVKMLKMRSYTYSDFY